MKIRISDSKIRLTGLVVVSLLVSVAVLSALPYFKEASALTSSSEGANFGIAGSAYKYSFGTNTLYTLHVTMSTSTGNDVLIVFTDSSAAGGYDTVIGVSDTAGLTWTHRATVLAIRTTYRDLEEWYTVIPATNGIVLVDHVSVTWATTFPLNTTKVFAFLISGANTSSPFDAGLSKPALGGNGTTPSISTSNGNDIVFSYANFDSQTSFSPSSGFTAINSTKYFDSNEYMITSAPLSRFPIQFSGPYTAGVDPIAQIADAVVPNPTTSSSSTTTSSSSSSSSSSTTLTSPTSTSSSSHTTTAAAYGGGLKFSIPRLLSDPILIGIIVIVAIAAIAAGILIRRRR